MVVSLWLTRGFDQIFRRLRLDFQARGEASRKFIGTGPVSQRLIAMCCGRAALISQVLMSTLLFCLRGLNAINRLDHTLDLFHVR